MTLKIIANDDVTLKQIGQVLASNTSRKIYNILVEDELNSKEIGKIVQNTEKPRLNILSFHLKKMVECGMVSYTMKQRTQNGQHLKHYKAVSLLAIMTPECAKVASQSEEFHKVMEAIA